MHGVTSAGVGELKIEKLASGEAVSGAAESDACRGELAQGLGLSRGYGVMISDVLPCSPADAAGQDDVVIEARRRLVVGVVVVPKPDIERHGGECTQRFFGA
jgi:S1-C subfamily serine protease